MNLAKHTGRQGTESGFTLIEIMVVVLIISILAAIAFPSYQDSVRKSNRGSAQAFMMEVAQKQQEFLLDRRRYAEDFTVLRVTAPADVTRFYGLAMVVANPAAGAPTFTLTATPVAGTVQVQDGPLTINNRGEKTPAGKW